MGYVAHVGEKKNVKKYIILAGKYEEENHLGDLCVDEEIIFKWILNKQGVNVLPGFIWLRTKYSSGLLCIQ
jgi:hypothetical protein